MPYRCLIYRESVGGMLSRYIAVGHKLGCIKVSQAKLFHPVGMKFDLYPVGMKFGLYPVGMNAR